jgi:murein DD-endopeptidase MepM/ murein hydrolase activator NlpD
MELTAIYEARIDFRRDLQKDDRVGAIYDRKIRLGKTWGAVTVRSAFIETRKNRIYAFYNEEDESYYDETGNTLASLFLKYPVQFRKIASEYLPSGRIHPIFGVTRPHLGVDFAAAKGTPVSSVADGTVRFRGCQKECTEGYGRLVIVEHKNGWESRYAHLSGFATALAPGGRVKQGQTVGFVGSSGVATGSHLHFEVRKGSQTVNPLSLRNVRQNGLSGDNLEKFLAEAKLAQTTLDYLADLSENGVTRLSSATSLEAVAN